MRELWNFVVWQCQQFQLWQWAFMLAAFLQGVGWTLGGEWGPWIALSGGAIILLFLLKWAVWDSTRAAWQRYRDQRNSLLTTIKHSDH